ncbi:MAG TPA: MoaD/ThiS family protein, partial [Rhodothermales bacterium]|nr:MoaD/ThiS family protein [Rhodothermales bacterium]
IRFFAILRELTGMRTLAMSLDKPEEVGVILDRLVAHHPAIGPYRTALRAAVNQEYVDEAFTVFNGDELAVITPVSGG